MTRRRTPEVRRELVNNVFAMSKSYHGSAILVPGSTVIAKALEIPVGKLYYGGVYPDMLVASSGLSIIHEGLTLGDPNAIQDNDIQAINDTVDAQSTANRIESLAGLLSKEELASLIGRLANSLA